MKSILKLKQQTATNLDHQSLTREVLSAILCFRILMYRLWQCQIWQCHICSLVYYHVLRNAFFHLLCCYLLCADAKQ